jgi:hypothetical protein
MLIGSWVASGRPMRITTRKGDRYDLVVLGVGQEERSSADPYSQRGNLLICRFDATGALLSLRIADLATAEPAPLSPTDPRHPEYVEERKVITPIAPEAMASRKRRTENRHDQEFGDGTCHICGARLPRHRHDCSVPS